MFDDGVYDRLAWVQHLRHFGANFTVLPPPSFLLHRTHDPFAWGPQALNRVSPKTVTPSEQRLLQKPPASTLPQDQQFRLESANRLLHKFMSELRDEPRLGCYRKRKPAAAH